MVALLVQNMERLDEQVKEEADGIYNTLGKEVYTKALTVTLKSLFILKETAIMACKLIYKQKLKHSFITQLCSKHIVICDSISLVQNNKPMSWKTGLPLYMSDLLNIIQMYEVV